MASVAEVLAHLVQHAPGLSDERRQEFLDAIAAEPGLARERVAPPSQPYSPPPQDQEPEGA